MALILISLAIGLCWEKCLLDCVLAIVVFVYGSLVAAPLIRLTIAIRKNEEGTAWLIMLVLANAFHFFSLFLFVVPVLLAIAFGLQKH